MTFFQLGCSRASVKAVIMMSRGQAQPHSATDLSPSSIANSHNNYDERFQQFSVRKAPNSTTSTVSPPRLLLAFGDCSPSCCGRWKTTAGRVPIGGATLHFNRQSCRVTWLGRQRGRSIPSKDKRVPCQSKHDETVAVQCHQWLYGVEKIVPPWCHAWKETETLRNDMVKLRSFIVLRDFNSTTRNTHHTIAVTGTDSV